MQDRLGNLSLRQIRYFVVVAEAKSFRRASEILHISQPPLTQHIKTLEETLGVVLFDRGNRQIKLTKAGEELLSSSQNLIRTLTDNLERVKAIGRGLEGTIRIGITNDYMYSPALSQIQEFCDSRPGISVEIDVNMSPVLAERLHQNKLDLIFTVKNPSHWKGDFIVHELPPCRLVVLAPINHPLASRSEMSIGDLDNEMIVTYPVDCDLPIAIECRRLFTGANVVPHSRYYTSHADIAVQLAAKGLGFALASEHSIPGQIDQLAIIPLTEDAKIERILMCQNNRSHPALAALIDKLLAG